MATVAALVVEARASAREDERRYPCDLCHTAYGGRFFDCAWVCAACVEVAREQLRREERRTTGAIKR